MNEMAVMIWDSLKAMTLPCLIALPPILLARWLTYKKTGRWDKKRETVMVLFFLYLTVVLSQTILPDSYLHFDFTSNAFHFPNAHNTRILFSSPIGWIRWMIALNNFAEIIRNIGGNILLFVPFGLLFPCLFPQRRRWTIPFGMMLSLFIEMAQLFSDRITDINDVFLYIFGILIGYLIYCIIRAIIEQKLTKSMGEPS